MELDRNQSDGDNCAHDTSQVLKTENETETDALNQEHVIDEKSTRGRTRKRKSVYQTEGLVREVSPKLEPSAKDDKSVESIDQKPPTSTYLNGKRAVECNICKRYMTESKLANHIRLMHVDESKKDGSIVVRPYKCEHCGKSYSIKYTWQQHVKTHTEGRPKCPECGDTFASAFGLFRHRVRNHDVEHNFKTFNCQHCDKSFFSISELTLHQQRHSSDKGFVCPECSKAFSVKGNLRIHMRTHAKEKLYKCDLCENSFSHPYSLVSHRRIHTNDYPFKCEICNKG